MLRNFWKTKPTEVVEAPSPTPADLEAQAHAEYVEANRVWLDAWTAIRGFYARHDREHGRKYVGDNAYQQLTIDPELTVIASRENHARIARDKALDRWSKLKPKPNETVFIAGVQVNR